MPEINEINNSLGELEEELRKLKTYVENIETAKVSVQTAADTAVKLDRVFKVLIGNTSKLLDKIDKIDFPSKLDKLDSTVSSINQNISNVQARIESMERNIKDDIRTQNKNILDEMGNQNKVLELYKIEVKKGIIFNRVLSFTSIFLIILLGVIYYLK